MSNKSKLYIQMRELARKQAEERIKGIDARNQEMNFEYKLEQLILANQNLPEQIKCYHGMYSTVGSTSNVCSECFWVERNPCPY